MNCKRILIGSLGATFIGAGLGATKGLQKGLEVGIKIGFGAGIAVAALGATAFVVGKNRINNKSYQIS